MTATQNIRLKYLYTPSGDANHPSEEVLSVYREHGVIPKSSRSDNYNKTPESVERYLLVRPGDLVVNRMKAWQGSLGVSSYRGIVSGDYEVLRPASTAISGRYMHYALRSRHMIGEYRVRSTGIRPSQWRLYWDQMGDIRISLPPLEEQERIADYLDHEITQIDTLIKEQQQLVEMLRERRGAVSTAEINSGVSLTTGQRLKHVVTGVTQGWSPQCYPWPADGVEAWGILKAGAANGGMFRPHENKELPEDQAPRPDSVVQRGHLVVSRANTRDLVGSAAVVEGDFPRLMLSDKLYAFDLDETKADPVYVATVLGTPRLRGLIELEATGASPSMQNISQNDILNLPMDLPAVDVQHQVVSHIREQNGRIDTLITESECLIELSQERRAALITAAVTGQIDVSQEG
ncbi:restriction endonuclease subunit S [Streptomyces sp. 2314.4]|uniref:restriction endonuclease subunit S n=1 Tax=Streptomyces sp. 2314.4 TaxID=1881025 RepID=UPI00089ADB98|nr:restriction endonuclease subunit S [Streptomyces sp. 2314.4]SED42310.1 type I restriction enzyme, S subunit [Streptomyces sp. 2314.4]